MVAVSGFAGARLYYVFQHWNETSGDFWGSLFGNAGLTWYGGFLGGFIGVIAWCLWRKVPLGLAANAAAPALAMGYAVGRIGCQLSGDGDYGRPTDLPWGMGYPNGVVPTAPGVHVHPTPVYETLVMLVVFWLLFRMAKKPQPGWYVFGWFLLAQGVERFLVEFLRLNPSWLAGLTAPQWTALVTGAVGVALIVVQRGKPPADADLSDARSVVSAKAPRSRKGRR